MIVRDALRCATCNKLHVVRIGMGQEERQSHRFHCNNCREEIGVALVMEFATKRFWVELEENAVEANEAEEPTPAIVNLDANFLIPADMQGVDKVFPRLRQAVAMVKQAHDEGYDLDSFKVEPNQRPPEFEGEWKSLRKAWNLYRNGQGPLCRAEVRRASETYYSYEPVTSLADWLWRFASNVSGRKYGKKYAEAMSFIRNIENRRELFTLMKHYDKEMAPHRGGMYFKIINDYFNLYADFSQIHFSESAGFDPGDDHVASYSNFNSTKMFYGNAFEVLGSVSDVLAFISNVSKGRSFDQFEKLTKKQFYQLDKIARFNPFSDVLPLAGLCEEADNQLRNGSHHGDINFDVGAATVWFKAGKGGQGDVQAMPYASYLRRSAKLFLQTVTILRIELTLASHFDVSRPL